MALRRLAQENNAASNPGSPRSPKTGSPSTIGTSQSRTPRNKRQSIVAYRSPVNSPSLSSSIPFDWDAARRPSLQTPPNNKRPENGRTSASGTPVRKRLVRKKGFFEKITDLHSNIAHEFALFPHNVPLPPPKLIARVAGGAAHFVHLCVRISQLRKTSEWDIYEEAEDGSWFDWTTPLTCLLIAGSLLNAFQLLSRVRLYQLHNRVEAISSPHATFVSANLDPQVAQGPSVAFRARRAAWHAFVCFWRFLLGMSPSARGSVATQQQLARVQQLAVWVPGDLETELFCLYSPGHALLWIGIHSSNWMVMVLLMGVVTTQLSVLVRSYAALLKDKEIIAAEVMSEYNQKFVNPRLFPIRKDAAVMTTRMATY